jgi:heme/copper-type cytochrome/quinol oxidase subunit 2
MLQGYLLLCLAASQPASQPWQQGDRTRRTIVVVVVVVVVVIVVVVVVVVGEMEVKGEGK